MQWDWSNLSLSTWFAVEFLFLKEIEGDFSFQFHSHLYWPQIS